MANYIVSNLNNSGPGSLRQAVLDANALAGADSISFSVSGTITLASQLGITDDVTINGDRTGDNKADVIISGNNASRIFDITAVGTDVTLNSLTLTNGGTNALLGGAIKIGAGANETLTINNTSILNSTSINGGGIYSNNGASVTINNSLISNNTAVSNAAPGGGISINSGSLLLINTTVTGNHANQTGGGIGVLGGAAVNIVNSTITNNNADFDGATTNAGGGIAQTGSTVNVINTVVSGNTSGAGLVVNDVAGTLASANSSVFSTAPTITTSTANLFNQNAGAVGLGTLGDHGGTTQTQNILAGSVLINRGSNAGISSQMDANGNVRISGGTVDVGATEFGLEVNTLLDVVNPNDNLLSLREAIAIAETNPGADAITFKAGLSGTITLTSQLSIANGSTVTINGDNTGEGNPDITLNGNNASRHFFVNAGATLSLQSLALNNGNVSNSVYTGGSIANIGTLSIIYCDFLGNSGVAPGGVGTVGYAAAGAIWNGGTLTITQSTLSAGTATGGLGGFGVASAGFVGGGAASGIVNEAGGTLSISHTVITGGTVTGGQGGLGANSNAYGVNGFGGGNGGDATHGIFNQGAITVGSSVQNRTPGIITPGNGGLGGNGGGGGGQTGAAGAFGAISTTNMGNLTNLGTESDNGTSGADTIVLGNYSSFFGLNGDDILNAGREATLNGGAGNDDLRAGDFSMLVGGLGNDILNSLKNSTVLGGQGNDRLIDEFVSGTGNFDGGEGIDTIDLSQDTLSGRTIDLNLASFAIDFSTFSNFENIDDFSGGNTIIDRNSFNNIINAGGGDDTVQMTYSTLGDVFNGGTGTNTLVQAGTFDGAVVMNMATGFVTFGGNNFAQFSNFQNVSVNGGMGIIGDAQNNVLIGIATAGALNIINNFQGGAGDDTLRGGLGGDTLDGGTNTAAGDTLDYSTSAAGVLVNLINNIVSGGDADNDFISNFENIIGSGLGDNLVEGDGRTSLFGGLGNDTLFINSNFADVAGEVFDGGGDSDKMFFFGTGAGQIHNMRNDSILGIENFLMEDSGANNSRTLLLNASQFGGTGIASNAAVEFDNHSDTTETIDILMGTVTNLNLSTLGLSGITSTARFVVTGDADAETIAGSSIKDTISGLAGDDIINGGAGGDILDGGTNTAAGDSLSYATSVAGVNVNLGTNTASGGDAQGDIISNFENATGSAFGDQLVGDGGANVLTGGAGNDLFVGGLGADTMIGGADLDVVDYSAFTAGVAVDLTLGTGPGGDLISEIENMTGSAFGDVLIGNNGANTMRGGMGNDFFVAGNGADLLIGGADNDEVSYATATTGVFVNLTTGVGANGGVLQEIENIRGSNFGDVLQGDNGANTIRGLDGNDFIIAGNGADLLIGGNDNDTVSYETATAGIFANLTTGIGANGGVLQEIENLTGSNFGDVLIGSAGGNTLKGGAGNDFIVGNAGSDALYGGADNDTFRFETTTFGNDVIVDFQDNGDKLSFAAAVATTFGQFTILNNNTTNVTVQIAGQSIVVQGVANIFLNASDFLFV